MGRAGAPPLDRSAVETAAGHPNITLIGSAVDERAILGAIHTLGPDRLCFGSDMPFRLMHVVLTMYRAMLRDFDEADRAKVLGGNLARLLSLK
jgi:predicted TIM-barrel fold metal-dependent hydrolase